MAKKIVAANQELTEWIKTHPDDAQKMLIAELKAETRTDVPADAVTQAMKRIQLTTEVSPKLLEKAVKDGKDTGFIKDAGDTSRLIQSL